MLELRGLWGSETKRPPYLEPRRDDLALLACSPGVSEPGWEEPGKRRERERERERSKE